MLEITPELIEVVNSTTLRLRKAIRLDKELLTKEEYEEYAPILIELVDVLVLCSMAKFVRGETK
ncbi:hypothetical protein [Cloacibacillus sp. An23]|uniref:hypothetical protein n=1 Tax=Cloacibacillus sp. An23 TaxID=1965591 RepID=UPI000B36CD8A|nr:hypothetical protein [Cloacibacillus sp. An23]OUO94785.1 hypothetical protein B5F39_02640 [Cloacibacillus sp. An23]